MSILRFPWLCVLLTAGLAFSSISFAAPANPEPRQFVQPDGSVFTAIPRGDEWLTWYETAGDRIALFNRQSRAFEFARIAMADGRYKLQSTGIRLGQTPPTFTIPAVDLLRAWQDARRAVGAESAEGSETDSAAFFGSPAGMTSTATISNPDVFKTLVVMVNFTDQQIVSADSAWNHRFFGGYPGPVAADTVNDYYGEVGRGRFWFAPAEETAGTPDDGIVKVTLSIPHPQAANDYTVWKPVLYQALRAANAYVDFASFDVDSDGIVEKDELQVVFVVAGRESSFGGYQDRGLWGHASSFSGNTASFPLLDGVQVARGLGRYMAVGELHGPDSGLYDSTIGILAHELGHSALLLGDLYGAPHDIEAWGLMGQGSWGRRSGERSGTTPVHLIGPSKLRASLPSGTGLIDPTVIVPGTAAQRVDLYHAHAGDNYGLIRIDNPAGGFFVIENRKVAGYDEGMTRYGLSVGDSGVLVSYYQGRNSVMVYRAGGGSAGTTTTADLFFLGNNARLAPDTTPSSALPGGSRSDLVLENISGPGEVMSVDIRDQPFACREFAATLAQHESAGRSRKVTTGTWWKKTEYFAVGSGQLLGTASYITVTLREPNQNYFEKGECPDGPDVTPPVLTLKGSAQTQAGVGIYWEEPGFLAVDDRDGDITGRVVRSGAVDYNTIGSYTLRYNVSDLAGNSAPELIRTVSVVAIPACVQHSATVQAHIAAGRATACGSYNLHGCAVGSGTSLGFAYLSTPVILKEQPAGYYNLGNCQQ